MAKSIRSKRKRKMRAIKRVRYGLKELERLKKTVQNDPIQTKKEIDVIMKEAESSDMVTVVNANTIKENSKRNDEDQVDGDGIKRKYNRKTLKNQFGSYPVWMNQRKIKRKKRKELLDKKMLKKQSSNK